MAENGWQEAKQYVEGTLDELRKGMEKLDKAQRESCDVLHGRINDTERRMLGRMEDVGKQLTALAVAVGAIQGRGGGIQWLVTALIAAGAVVVALLK